MPEIPSIGHGAVGPINRAVSSSASSASAAVRAHSNGVRKEDRVELSDHARLLDRLRSLPEVRQELVDRVRDEIASGKYESPEKLDEALQRLLQDLIA
jgi:negative regulator of flagellin synthesis FlgM